MGKSKGRETEHDALALYEAAGYEVYQPPKAKYREQDVFGLFDLLVFGHDRLVGTQVKTNRPRAVTKWFDEATVYAEHIDDLEVEYLVRYEDEGWKIYRPDGDDYTVAYDGREIDSTPGPELIEVLRR